jgi:hypothetical protein
MKKKKRFDLLRTSGILKGTFQPISDAEAREMLKGATPLFADWQTGKNFRKREFKTKSGDRLNVIIHD